MKGTSVGAEAKYQVMPDLEPNEYRGLKADIAERGVLVPVVLDEQGAVIDGHHRVRACRELGITDYPTKVEEGLDEVAKRSLARTLNAARRHLSPYQRRALILDELLDEPARSNRVIAHRLGVSPTTVGTVRRQVEATGQLSKLDSSVGADGKSRPVHRRSPDDRAAWCQPLVDVFLWLGKRLESTADLKEVVLIRNIAEAAQGYAKARSDTYMRAAARIEEAVEPPWIFTNEDVESEEPHRECLVQAIQSYQGYMKESTR